MSKGQWKLNIIQVKTEILSGLTVAFALIPGAIAFAFVSNVEPLVGLYAAFIVCLVASLFGGRPGMISGAAGALAVVTGALVTDHGVEYLFATIILMGILQVMIGVLKFGKFIRILPYPVMLGFVNGLAIVIFLSQLNQFKSTDAMGQSTWLTGSTLYTMLALVAATMAIMHFLPKITQAIPSALAAILIVFGITQLFNIETPNVGDMASIAGSFPPFHIPQVPFTWETLKIILPYASALAAIGLIQSLITMKLIDEVTETHGHNSRECMAQGIANVAAGFFGSMGGCGVVGQSMINIGNGALHRLSGVAAALFLLGASLFGAPLIEKIPLAALVGVMFMVVIATFAWSSLRIINKIPRSDACIIIVVSALTVIYDLAVAVFIGVIIAALVYVWKSSRHIFADTHEDQEKQTKIYMLYGPLFFGSIVSFRQLFDPNEDPDTVIVDFKQSRVWDHSAIEILQKLAEIYRARGKNIKYRHLSADCVLLLGRIGEVVESDIDTDPHYEVVMDH